jgi:hypothetical protein
MQSHVKPNSLVELDKILQSLSIDELNLAIEMIDDIKMRKSPYLVIRDNFTLLGVKTNDISWIGETFHSDHFTHIVTTIWQIDDEIYKLVSTARGWCSWGDHDIEHYSDKWLETAPNEFHREVAEHIGKYIAHEIRVAVDEVLLEKFLTEDEELQVIFAGEDNT